MKKIIFIFGFFPLINLTYGQTFSVGSTCCNYNLINKTFTVNGTPCSSPPSDYYAFDIDGDLAPDLKVSSFNSPPCFAGGVQSKGIMITSTTNCEFVYSTAVDCPYRYPANLTFGSSLNSSLNWSITPVSWNIGQASPYLYYEYINPSSMSYTCSIKVNPFYVGFKKVIPSGDTIYGWIHMDTNFPGKLIDYAFTCGTYTAAPPSSTITTSPSALCRGDSIQLNATPSSGIFIGSGVNGNYFKTKNLAQGVYTVNYALSNPGGCSINSSSIIFTVNPLPSPSFLNLPVGMCSDDSLILNATPSGGVYSGTVVSGNVYYPPATGFGNQTVYYTYTDMNGCSGTASLNVWVNSCVGINEFTLDNNILTIYPNPSSCEFEIKGIKKETIFITNELGQLIETKNLSSQNNYSAKINNLQSGVYFVGNKFSRQKIVVIN